jgi:NAD(P)-dependent dehydrogenase (short-subunit alcohol dehydrogenase family)
MAGILEGKVAIITGASSGIGQASARIFAREGAKLVLADVIEDGGNRTLKMVQDLGAEAIFVKCDVSKWTDVEEKIVKGVEK